MHDDSCSDLKTVCMHNSVFVCTHSFSWCFWCACCFSCENMLRHFSMIARWTPQPYHNHAYCMHIQHCTFAYLHLHLFSKFYWHAHRDKPWLNLSERWLMWHAPAFAFPCLVLSHLFPLYRPAALCWYRADIWTGVTWVICSHGLQQWLAKTGQLSSG